MSVDLERSLARAKATVRRYAASDAEGCAVTWFDLQKHLDALAVKSRSQDRADLADEFTKLARQAQQAGRRNMLWQ